MNAHYVSIYVTCKNAEEAKKIAHSLLQERLIACANISEKVISVYEWQGEIHEDEESVVMMKTGKAHVETVIERIKALHSYDCPCIVALPILYGDGDYLNWIDMQTS